MNRDEGFDCICSDGYTGDGVIECVDMQEYGFSHHLVWFLVRTGNPFTGVSR